MTYKWNINLDITFRTVIGIGLLIFTCIEAVKSNNPVDWFGWAVLAIATAILGSKALSCIKTPWFSIGNGTNGDTNGKETT